MTVKQLGLLLSTALLLLACSTKRNTSVNRKYHEVNTYFNVLFNGRESYQQAAKRAEAVEPPVFDELLPVFAFQYPEVSSLVSSEMHRAIGKGEKAILKHSITAKPKKKKNLSKEQKDFLKLNEYNPWIDESHLLIGQAHLYLNDYGAAESKFSFINSEFPKDNETVAESRLYQAIIANREGELNRSESILQTLSRSKKFPPKLEPLLNATYADFYIQKKLYPQAIVYLKKTLEQTTRRSTRIRYNYLLAQLFEKTNNKTEAAVHYRKVLKLNPPYLTSFSAEMALAYSQSPVAQNQNVRKMLEKALKNPRNEAYKDQIYYALAKIEENANAMPKAIDLYKKSISESKQDRQKALAHLALAQYYIKKPDYINAYENFEAANKLLPETHTSSKDVNTQASKLRKLATNMKIVQHEDSLRVLAGMSDRDRKNAIEDQVKQVEQAALAAQQQDQQLIERNLGSIKTVGQWYFYNPTALNLGQTDFQNRWGKRKLEDNWRRTNKSGQVLNFDDSVFDNQQLATSTATPGSDSLSLAEKFAEQVPTTTAALAASDDKIAQALFYMAEAYRDDLKNTSLAIKTFEELNLRYPVNNYQAASFVALYQLYGSAQQPEEAANYKKMMLARFPTDPQVLAALDPSYINRMLQQEQQEESRYLQIVDQYSKNTRSNSAQNMDAYYSAEKAIADFPKSRLKPQFILMRTLSDDYKGDIQKYQLALKNIIADYPKTTAAQTAQSFLIGTEQQESTWLSAGQTAANQELITAIEYSKAESVHFFVIIADKDVDLKKLQFEVQSFNAEQYIDSDLELQVQDYADRKMILTGEFKSKKMAQAYFSKINQRPYIGKLDPTKSTLFLISDINLFLFRDSKTISDYYTFFKREYLK